MRSMRFVLIGAIVMLVSCGGKSSPQVQELVQTSDSLASPNSNLEETGALSIADAGVVYLEIVNPVNCANRTIIDLESANSLGNGTADPAALSEMLSAFEKLAAARQIAFRSLMSKKWPDVIAPEIELMARDWAKAANAEEFLSGVVDVGAYNVAVASYLDLMSKSSANPGFIRATLGVGPASETDQC